MNKAEMIEKYGEQWYEDFKAKSRKSAYEKYHANEELARARLREKAKKNIESRRAYVNTRRTVYRINSRDSLRLKKLGLLHDGLEAHHMKYHTDKKRPDLD